MVEEQVLLALTSGSPSPTSAGSRVYGVVLPQVAQDEGLPAVSYQRISSAPVNDYDGHSNLDKVRIQVDAWARTYGAAKQLAGEIRAALTAASFKALLESDFDEFEEESKLYRVSTDYELWQGL